MVKKYHSRTQDKSRIAMIVIKDALDKFMSQIGAHFVTFDTGPMLDSMKDKAPTKENVPKSGDKKLEESF